MYDWALVIVKLTGYWSMLTI